MQNQMVSFLAFLTKGGKNKEIQEVSLYGLKLSEISRKSLRVSQFFECQNFFS